MSGQRTDRLREELTRIWETAPGLGRFSAVNHSVVGMRFLVTAVAFFAIGGLLAMIIRAQLATPHSAFLGAEIYNQIFTMHGTVMMFLFAIPMFEGLAVYLLPKMLGARDLAFPRLTAYGYWCYLFGGTILIVALVAGAAPDTGWFMYTPLSSDVHSPGINADVWLLGVTFVEISALTLAVEVTVSILKMRAPGMSLGRMPIFAWYSLIVALMIVVGFPPLILGSILLETERAFGLPFFDPVRGGDPILWQHLFWLFGHPEVYIIFLPAAGVLSTVIPVYARHPLIGYRVVVASIVALGFLSFGIWVHHMFAVGIPHLALAFFSAASALVTVPTAVQIFAWLGTMTQGRVRWDVPMLHVFGFFFVFVLGGLTGVMLAMVPFDWQAHDTHFVVAHLHYVLVGGFVFPMLAGLYHWLPLVTGREAVHRLAVPAFWLIFIGFNLTFFMMHLTGLLGMPRRIYTYPGYEGWVWLNLLSSIGGFVLSMGLALVLLDVVLHARFGRPARQDPQGAGTLEWRMPLPPPPYAHAALPEVTARVDQVMAGEPSFTSGRGYLATVRNGWQETLGVNVTSGRPDQVIILSRQTYLPFIAAAVTGVAVLAMLFKLYYLALGAAVGVAVVMLISAQRAGQRVDHGPLEIGHGISVPPHTEVADPPPWWALLVTLVADFVLFASLIFGTAYLWTAAPNWPPEQVTETGWRLPLIALAGLFLVPLAARGAIWANGRQGLVAPWLGLGALGVTVAIGGLVAFLILAVPDPREHGSAAVSAALLGYAIFHAGVAGLFLISNLLRLAGGFIGPRRNLDLRLSRIWADYTAVSGAVALVIVLMLPWLAPLTEARI